MVKKKETHSAGCFPRTNDIPAQSPKYWAKEKDRYIRQYLIEDIESETKRPLIVYFSQLDQQINHTDPDDISEIIQGVEGKSVDLFIQTPGGLVDATEKIISLISHAFDDYRVIVPSWAKSAGTVIALSSDAIVLGMNSEHRLWLCSYPHIAMDIARCNSYITKNGYILRKDHNGTG